MKFGRIILPNFIRIRFETTKPGLFEERRLQQEQQQQQQQQDKKRYEISSWSKMDKIIKSQIQSTLSTHTPQYSADNAIFMY